MDYLDLFGGIGGFRLGIERATKGEWKCAGYYDIDRFAVQTYNKNFGENHEPTDIRTVPAESIPDHDLLCAGFPCQSFSKAQKEAMLPEDTIKEKLSEAYVRAISCFAGYNLDRTEDDFGIDLTIKDVTGQDGKFIPTGHNLEVQIKATQNHRMVDSYIVYDLPMRNYNILRDPNAGTARILVLLCLPAERQEWLNQTVDSLTLKKCAFWNYFVGSPESDNQYTVAVRIPTNHIFSMDILRRMIDIIKAGGDLNEL